MGADYRRVGGRVACDARESPLIYTRHADRWARFLGCRWVISGHRKRRTLRPVLSAVSALPAFLRYFVAPAVSPPRQYFPRRINAAISGNTLISEPRAIR
jgi:hypothetical protein